MVPRDVAAGFVAGLLGVAVWRRAGVSAPGRLARHAGISIARPDAVGWCTDFLNAAYYRRPRGQASVEDLRLAFAILTTRWHQLGRPLTAADVLAFHWAFVRDRWLDRPGSRRGTLDRAQLLAGADRLLGAWFTAGWADPTRRGWGIVFPDSQARADYRPERRLGTVDLGPPRPPTAPEAHRTWHTYPAVPLPDAHRAWELLAAPERWPDFGSALGRFTPVRPGGLPGQTFEIEVLTAVPPGAVVIVRAYVTATRVLTRDEPALLRDAVAALGEAHRRHASAGPPPLPAGADPVALIELTTHEDHFMGAAVSRLLVFSHDGRDWIRDAGVWDPLPPSLDLMYSRLGRHAQHAFWGVEDPDGSVLVQLADQAATAPP